MRLFTASLLSPESRKTQMTNATPPPAGWYPNPEDPAELRWWDGRRWSSRTAAPDTVAAAPATTKVSTLPGKVPISTWVCGALALVFALSALSAGVGSFLIFAGLIAGGTALYTLITKRRGWALLPTSRPVVGAIAAGSLVVLLIGSGVYSASHPKTVPAAASVSSPTTSSTPRPSPSLTPTDGAEPLDPTTVVASDSAPTVAIANASLTSGSALDLLATLPVKGKAPGTGYARTSDFGTAWLDVDHNGCDTRNDILARDLSAVVLKGSCTVLSGILPDKYTGDTIDFTRGDKTSALVQIDHMVALQNAWITGAQQLTQAQRISLANDPLNLIAVDAKSNEQKSSGDAATWLPANKGFRCEYVARQISVKATYGLWVTQAEHDAMTRVLGSCSGQAAETSTFTPPAPTPTPTPAQAPAPAPAAPAPAPAAPAPAPAAPAPAPVAPGGATALCNDGSYSYAAHHQGACSHHGGVAVFYN
jgi:cell division protein FtsN